jgi:hypothetical protein
MLAGWYLIEVVEDPLPPRDMALGLFQVLSSKLVFAASVP